MLTPSYLLHATEPAEEIAEELHQDILNRIIERVKIRMERGDDYILTATDKWNIETLQEAGYLLEDIQKDIAKATGKLISEIAEAMEDAGVTALEYDDKIYRDAGLDPKPLTQSPNLIQIMQRDYEATMGDWNNFTKTTADAAYKKFVSLCDRAYHQAITGAISPSQAVREALGDLINNGLDVITYRDDQGRVTRRETIETAMTRAVRTGISQAAADIQIARMDEFGVDLVLVSSHLGARPSHQKWQGKIYSRTGTDYPDFVDSTGYGSVTGLCGANCRHSFGPYFGQCNPYEQFDSEENKERYELEQRQRELERRIRDTKRQVMGYQTAGDKENCGRKAALLQKQNAAYNQFCEENGLKKRSERISVAKWNRSEAAKARSAAKAYQTSQELSANTPYTTKKYQNTVEKAKSTGIIKVKNSELENGLPIKGKANTIVDKTDDNGVTLQRRVYGSDCMAKVDFDTSDHGLPKAHPTGAHKHVFNYNQKNVRGKPLKLTDEELKENEDIIKKGVNYHDEK